VFEAQDDRIAPLPARAKGDSEVFERGSSIVTAVFKIPC
jgi:hypothetical protein